jgi:excinuclease ABC subunit A
MAKKNLKAVEHHLVRSYEDEIVLEWVRTHNLKDIDITLPKNKIITVTGVSGSGKSSLAFDTIYKEGQFRYIESLSSYLRQFFNLGTRPEIDFSSGLSPAIAIEQNKRMANARSTVGTLTEIDDYLRLMLAKLGEVFCYKCGMPLRPKSTEEMLQDIQHRFSDKKVYLLAELKSYLEGKDLQKRVRNNRKKVDQGEGTTRFLVAYGRDETHRTRKELVEYFYLEDPKIPEGLFPVKVYGVFDRITINQSSLHRLKDDVIKMLVRAEKFGVMQMEDNDQKEEKETEETTDIGPLVPHDHTDQNDQIVRYTDKYYCPKDNIAVPEFTPQHFSPNRQEGACPTCHGIGEELQVDFDKVIDPHSSYLQAVLPRRDSSYGQAILSKLAQKYDVDTRTIWSELPGWFLEVVMKGDEELLKVTTGWGKFFSMYYKGIQDVLTSQYQKGILTVDFQAMLDLQPCSSCHGSKLRPESMSVYLLAEHTVPEKPTKKKEASSAAAAAGAMRYAQDITEKYSIYDLQTLPLRELIIVLDRYRLVAQWPEQLVKRIIKPLIERVRTITDLWLWFLQTIRKVESLSGGEIQRLRLAKQLGNKLTGIIYVLDEPTIGLDIAEIEKVITAVRQLQQMGNTIVVVEHNEEFIKASDRVVEIGPGAGDFGGNLLFNGEYEDFLKQSTLTADYISWRKKVQATFNHTPMKEYVEITQASQHNLQNISVKIQLGSFTIITWGSGAGKTTLMYHTLFKFLSEKQQFVQSFVRLHLLKKGLSRQDIIKNPILQRTEYEQLERQAVDAFYDHLKVKKIVGTEHIENVQYVDQSSIGKTPRSCPATFIGVFDDIRKLYAWATEAKMLWFTAGHFSFNSGKGACPECNGYGTKLIELQFLPDTYVDCELCRGKRYKPEILDIKRHGKSVSELLEMYVMDALDFFQDIWFIREKLQLMVEIGLWYLRMGQPAHTLSGGESQRLKLVKHLLKQYKGHTVYFLDEPTVGLHPSDIERLLKVLKKFLDNGDTVLMIEHEKNLLQFADKVIRLEDGKVVK